MKRFTIIRTDTGKVLDYETNSQRSAKEICYAMNESVMKDLEPHVKYSVVDNYFKLSDVKKNEINHPSERPEK